MKSFLLKAAFLLAAVAALPHLVRTARPQAAGADDFDRKTAEPKTSWFRIKKVVAEHRRNKILFTIDSTYWCGQRVSPAGPRFRVRAELLDRSGSGWTEPLRTAYSRPIPVRMMAITSQTTTLTLPTLGDRGYGVKVSLIADKPRVTTDRDGNAVEEHEELGFRYIEVKAPKKQKKG